MLLYLYHDLFFHVLYNSIINWDFNPFPATEVGQTSLQFPDLPYASFFSQTDIIATLQFVDSCSFEKRELIAAPQWQGLMPVLPWWINLLWLKVCRCFCCGSQCHKLGWDILFYILIFLEKFRDSLMKNCLQTQKTLKISRKKKFLYSLEFI